MNTRGKSGVKGSIKEGRDRKQSNRDFGQQRSQQHRETGCF